MAIPRKIILLWLALALLFATLLILQWHGARAAYLPVPGNPQTIRIQSASAAFTWQRGGNGWLMDGKPADAARIGDWLAQLRTCHGAYAPADIAPVDNPQPITLTIDGQTYELGAANPFADTHYLAHNGKIHLCPRAVKGALQLSTDLWLEKPDA